MPRGVLIEVSPDQARAWLATSTQDEVCETVVEDYVARMQQPSWTPEGRRPVKVRHGVLVDGNHRLTAVIRLNRPVSLYVKTRHV